MKLLRTKGRVRDTMTLDFGGVQLQLVTCYLKDGTSGMVADIPKDSLAAVERQAHLMGEGYRLVADDWGGFESIGAAPVNTPATASKANAESVVVLQLRTAKRNGWDDLDLDGVGLNGDSGPLGGFSSVTGLTLAQHAITIPPEDWSELRSTKYPWEIESWSPPGLDFKAPAVPAKVTVTDEDGEKVRARDDDGQFVGDDPETPDVNEAFVDGGEDTLNDEVDVGGANGTNGTNGAASYDEALKAWGDDNTIAAAREVFGDLIEKAKGDAPSKRKANFHLNKNGLPKVDESQLEALLRPLV